MKKTMNVLLALIVCISVVCTTFSITVFAESAVKVSPVYIESADGSITASAVVSNIDGTSETSVKLYLAQYTQNGVEAKSAQVTVPAGGEKIVNVTDSEVEDATIRCFLWEGDNCTPLSVPADKNAAPELSGISVNGVLLEGFNTGTLVYTCDVESGRPLPVIKGVPTNNALLAKTSYSDDVATVTVSNPSTNSVKVYSITLNYIAAEHAVAGALSNDNFSLKTNSTKYKTNGENNVYGSTDVVATKQLAGDGVLYKNLHASVYDENKTITSKKEEAVDLNNTGSCPILNYRDNSTLYWVIRALNDSSAMGADYFAFNFGTGDGKFGSYKYNGTNTLNTLADGEEWVKFTLAAPARVTLYTNANSISAYEADGWTGETSTTPYIVLDRTTRNTASDTTNLKYKVYKDFPAGEVVIKYHTVLNNNMRAPLITVVPASEIKDIVSDFENIVAGKSFDEYKTYAEENVVSTGTSDCDGTISFGIGVKENFGIGSIVDSTTTTASNSRRTVDYINPLYDLEGCYFVNFDPNNTANGSRQGWVVEAASGDVRKYSDGVGVGFENVVPWAKFKVNVDCDILVISVGELPSLLSKGYVEVPQGVYNVEENKWEYSSCVFSTHRASNNTSSSYTYLYTKSFEAGQIVDIYNCIEGYNDHIYLVRAR